MGKRKQTAVYWPSPVTQGSGYRTFGTPSEITVRWEDLQVEFKNQRGKIVRSSAVVLTGQDVDVGGYLYLGEEDDLDSDHDNPMEIEGAREIEKFDKVPNLRGTKYDRTAYLK